MKIPASSNGPGVQISFKERGLDGSARVSVAVSAHGYRGSNRKVWFTNESVERFQKQLADLESSRKGEAQIVAISEDDFSLKLQAVDLSGHINCSVNLGTKVVDFGKWLTNHLRVEFPIDPSVLPKICREFVDLTKDGK